MSDWNYFIKRICQKTCQAWHIYILIFFFVNFKQLCVWAFVMWKTLFWLHWDPSTPFCTWGGGLQETETRSPTVMMVTGPSQHSLLVEFIRSAQSGQEWMKLNFLHNFLKSAYFSSKVSYQSHFSKIKKKRTLLRRTYCSMKDKVEESWWWISSRLFISCICFPSVWVSLSMFLDRWAQRSTESSARSPVWDLEIVTSVLAPS